MEELWFEYSKFIYKVTIVSFKQYMIRRCIRSVFQDFSRNYCSLLEKSLVEWHRMARRPPISTSDTLTQYRIMTRIFKIFVKIIFIYKVTIVFFQASQYMKRVRCCIRSIFQHFSRNYSSLLERNLIEWQEDRLSPIQTLWHNFMRNGIRYNSNIEKLFWNNINI